MRLNSKETSLKLNNLKHKKSSSDYVPNEAIAVAVDEEDKKLKKKRVKVLEEKMEMLLALEEMVDGAVLDDLGQIKPL